MANKNSNRQLEPRMRSLEKIVSGLEVLLKDTRDDYRSLKEELNFLRNNDLKEINGRLTDIREKLLTRPGWLVTCIITFLSSLSIGLIVYIAAGPK